MASMSRYHFLRTFRAVIGTSPYQYLLALRLRRAFVDLERSPAPISTVAYEAGFRDLSTFNRRFRHLTRMTPREYRQSVWRKSQDVVAPTHQGSHPTDCNANTDGVRDRPQLAVSRL
jgi:AraC-like DNA-binding protein